MMIFELLRAYVIWLLASVALCVVGVCITLATDPAQTRNFLVSYIYYWNGLLVGMSCVGTLHFGMSTYKQQLHYLLFEIFSVTGDLQIILVAMLERLYSFWNKQIIALPILTAGTIILYVCGYPMSGPPQYFLWFSSSLMFYAGGLMLAYGVYALQLFHLLEKNIECVRLQDDVNIIEIENFNLYLSTVFLAATLALYFAFRGTLTANFTFAPPNQFIEHAVNLFVAPGSNYSSVRNLLVYPIVTFLPLALFAGFYVKLVLRKVYLANIKRKVLEIDTLAKPIIEDADAQFLGTATIEVRKTVMDLKEKIIQNNKVLPLVNLTDSPSIVLTLVVVIQFIWINDKYVKSFFEGLGAAIN